MPLSLQGDDAAEVHQSRMGDGIIFKKRLTGSFKHLGMYNVKGDKLQNSI